MEVFFSLILGYAMGCLNPAAWVGKRNHINLKEAGTGNHDNANSLRAHRPLGVVLWLDKLIFSGESPLTIRARLVCRRDCPNPLGVVHWQC